MSNDRPRLKLQPGGDKRAMLGHPWIFSNELVMDAAAKALPPGEIVTVIRPDGRPLGAAFFNPHSLIAARLLTRDADRAIDEAFLHKRLQRALKLRDRLIGAPFYRLVHAEADGFPGCIIDRFGDVVVVETEYRRRRSPDRAAGRGARPPAEAAHHRDFAATARRAASKA